MTASAATSWSAASGGGGAGSNGEAGQSGARVLISCDYYAIGGPGGNYGGGTGYKNPTRGPSNGSQGAVRIIWAGTTGITRAFPSTNTGDL
jgi:hypothetical protein